MTTIEKVETEKGYNFYIKVDEGILVITFAGNLDLYWDFKCDNLLDESDNKSFIIKKDNFFLYNLIDELYNSIKNYDFGNFFYKNDEEYKERFRKGLIDRDKRNNERLLKNDMVDYHSDDGEYDVVSSFQIKPLDEEYEITFNKGNAMDLYPTFAVRISNSGSRYEYFNILFMKMYNELIKYEPENHQIHIEEYIYQLKRTKKND